MRRQDTCIVWIAVLKANAVEALAFQLRSLADAATDFPNLAGEQQSGAGDETTADRPLRDGGPGR
jgi:hypothetical protein